MFIKWLRVLASGLALTTLTLTLADENDLSANDTLTTAEPEPPEPMWGRIYLRHGLAPIQYFRDRYGGPMVNQEVEFYVPQSPEHRLGCEPLPEKDQAVIRASNSTMVLVADRGVCSFKTKSKIAHAMGAAALVVVSSDESSSAPVAVLDPDEDDIPIASVMIRKTGGDLLRHVAARQRVFGRLIPMVCERKPYVCRGRWDFENEYIASQLVRSGVITAAASNREPIGDFLAASYGSVLPFEPLSVVDVSISLGTNGCLPISGDEAKTALKDRIGIVTRDSSCSVLTQVSHLQLAGAAVAIVSFDEGAGQSLVHPSVTENWHAYNITITAAAISTATRAAMTSVPDQRVTFVVRNSIATTWDEIRKLAVRSAWPTRTDRREKLLRRLLSTLAMDDGQRLELKRNYLTIGGGSGASWDRLVDGDAQLATTKDEL
ncbi:hypothetical protein ATCC90586_004139 [Pythium insidiosum]|nr:hypothetical protein ATCC90586_004139 [Pythium insidiosum]